MSKVTKAVSFDDVKHKALLRQVNALPAGTFSKVVRDALAAHFDIANGVTLTEVYQAIGRLDQKLSNGVVSIEVQADQVDDDDGDELDADVLGAFS